MDYDNDFDDERCQTSLGSIHFRVHRGAGQKLIFLHGLGGTTLVWKRLMEHMPKDLSVYLIDLLGHGESDAPDTDYTISAQFQVLREFIAQQNNGDSYIFGHSYGGWIAAYYASQPYTCKGIILEDAAGLKENLEDILSSGRADEYRAELLKSAVEFGNREEVMRSIIYSNLDEDRLDAGVLSRIRAPTLILWGTNDTVVDPKYSKVFNERIRGSVLELIDGAAHEPHYEQPGKVGDAILGFIAHK